MNVDWILHVDMYMSMDMIWIMGNMDFWLELDLEKRLNGLNKKASQIRNNGPRRKF